MTLATGPARPTGRWSGPVRARAGAVLVVLVLLGTAVAAIWLWGRHQPLLPQGEVPAGITGRRPADPLAIADFAGVRQQAVPFDDFAKFSQSLTPAEIAIYQGGGLRSVELAIGDIDGGTADVAVARLVGPVQARRAQRALVALQLGFGFTAAPHPPPGVGDTVLGVVPGQPAVLPGGRAHYVHGDLLVRVEFRGPGVAAAQQRFAGLLAQQLRVLPADG